MTVMVLYTEGLQVLPKAHCCNEVPYGLELIECTVADSPGLEGNSTAGTPVPLELRPGRLESAENLTLNPQSRRMS